MVGDALLVLLDGAVADAEAHGRHAALFGFATLDGVIAGPAVGGRGRAREKRPALVRRGKGKSPLKELANYAEREASLQLRAARTHQLVPKRGRALGGGR